MMKKCFVLLLTMMLLLLCACGQTESQQEQAEASNKPLGASDGTTEEPPVSLSEVSELYSMEGVYTNDYGMKYEYSYHIPQLTAKTKAAEEINREISEHFGSIAKQVQEDEAEREYYGYSSISWECYKNGDVLSLVVNRSNDLDMRDFEAYNYDTATKKRLYNADIIALKGLSEDEYLYALRRAAMKCFDEHFLIESEENMYGQRSPYEVVFSLGTPEVYHEKRVLTLSNENLNLGTADTYLDGNGEIAVCVRIESFAEAGYFNDVVTLDLSAPAASKLQAELDDILTAEISRGELSITFKKNDASDRLLYLENGYTGQMRYNEKLPVHGLYSTIKKIFCGYLPDEAGQGIRPYVFLITEEGHLAYVDILSGVLGGYLCASDPLPWIQNAVRLEGTLNAENKATVIVTDADGRQTDLASIVYEEQRVLCFQTEGEWALETTYEPDGYDAYTYRYNLINRLPYQISVQTMIFGGDHDLNYEGSFTYLGMTEDGVVYYYKLHSVDGISDYVYEGVAALCERFVFEGYSTMNKLFVKELGGTGLVGSDIGMTSELTEAMG